MKDAVRSCSGKPVPAIRAASTRNPVTSTASNHHSEGTQSIEPPRCRGLATRRRCRATATAAIAMTPATSSVAE